MNEQSDCLTAFGSIEEGDTPLQPYIDSTVFDTLDKQAQVDLLSPVFDAIKLAGVDYDLKVQETSTGKRYTLLKENKVVDIFIMDSDFADHAIKGINKSQKDS